MYGDLTSLFSKRPLQNHRIMNDQRNLETLFTLLCNYLLLLLFIRLYSPVEIIPVPSPVERKRGGSFVSNESVYRRRCKQRRYLPFHFHCYLRRIFSYTAKETGLFVVIIITLFATYAPRTPNVIQTDKRNGVKRKKRKEAAWKESKWTRVAG